MKASLLARAAPVLLLAATLASGAGTAGFAQTTPAAPPATSAAPATSAPAGTTSAGSTAPAAPATATTAHHATTPHARRVATRAPAQTMMQMAEQRIADLHTRLHVTAAQQSSWDQFAQVMRDNAKDVDQAYQQRAASFDKMNAVENMQSYAQIEQTRAQDMQKLVPAFQTLYTALSDQQKQQADMLFRNQAARATQRHPAAKH
jgi:periplasmic protein CpxP/Spy